jgi:hypothetical protein
MEHGSNGRERSALSRQKRRGTPIMFNEADQLYVPLPISSTALYLSIYAHWSSLPLACFSSFFPPLFSLQ